MRDAVNQAAFGLRNRQVESVRERPVGGEPSTARMIQGYTHGELACVETPDAYRSYLEQTRSAEVPRLSLSLSLADGDLHAWLFE